MHCKISCTSIIQTIMFLKRSVCSRSAVGQCLAASKSSIWSVMADLFLLHPLSFARKGKLRIFSKKLQLEMANPNQRCHWCLMGAPARESGLNMSYGEHALDPIWGWAHGALEVGAWGAGLVLAQPLRAPATQCSWKGFQGKISIQSSLCHYNDWMIFTSLNFNYTSLNFNYINRNLYNSYISLYNYISIHVYT